MFMNEMLVGHRVVSQQQHRFTLEVDSYFAVSLPHREGPVYVSVWFNQEVLKDCIVLSYVSVLCFLFCFTQHGF